MMEIKNPYGTPAEHKVYNQNFLDSVGLEIAYKRISFASATKPLRLFFKEKFNVSFEPDGQKTLTTINIFSKNNIINFNFSTESVKIDINGAYYVSFQKTVLPLLPNLLKFLEIVSVSKLERVTLTKKNKWKLEGENILEQRKEALAYTFKEDEILELAKVEIPEEKFPIKLSRTGSVGAGAGRLTAEVVCQFPDRNEMGMSLNLIAECEKIKVEELTGALSLLNEIIYCAFHQMVSDNVISIMEK